MNRDEILKKVNDVFKDVFDDKNLVISDETTANDIDDWDSLTHITLIAAIEEELGVKFEMADIVKFKNVGDMVDAICEKICK
ncbi:MAG: acyl carrier protein [Lachnospiraceae bacterium]|nr:acyl carrier protein [Lachnospiraceae bacterium]